MVVHLRKELIGPPAAIHVAGVSVRPFDVPNDVEAWLALRQRAIADLRPAPRRWLHADYQAEMYDKPWWSAERNWLAVADGAPDMPVGAVTLAVREGKARSVAVVHWLLVDRAWRRRGIGRLLTSQLEQAAWDAGWREVQLETHAAWSAAVAFYDALGYAAVDTPSGSQ
jgi:GNAT superfamily N-acetyltransferase